MPNVRRLRVSAAEDAGTTVKELLGREEMPTLAAIRQLRQRLEADLEAIERVEALLLEPYRGFRSFRKNPHVPEEAPKVAAGGASSGIRDAVRASLESFTKAFTAAEVKEHLQRQNFKFESDPKAAVRDALYVIAKSGKGLRLVQKGKGGKPNLYERI